jgi:hypothetical protein
LAEVELPESLLSAVVGDNVNINPTHSQLPLLGFSPKWIFYEYRLTQVLDVMPVLERRSHGKRRRFLGAKGPKLASPTPNGIPS